MPTHWLHLEEMFSDPWILPIYAALNKKGLLANFGDQNKELGASLTMNLNILPVLVNRTNQDIAILLNSCEDHSTEHIFTPGHEGYALPIDRNIKYSVLSDINSLLFEIKSCSELVTSFFVKVYGAIGKNIGMDDAGPIIRNIIVESKQDPSWFITLCNHRNFFIHEGSPYLAIDISKGKGKYEVIVLRKNIIDLSANEDWFPLSVINKITDGFCSSNPLIQRHLIKEINSAS